MCGAEQGSPTPARVAGTEEHALPPDVNDVPSLIEFQAGARPDAVALLAPDGQKMTYAALGDRVRRLADALRRHGLHRRSRVAIVLPNGPEMAVVMLGVSAACAALPLNPACTRDEFLRYFELLRPDGVLSCDPPDGVVRGAARERGLPVWPVRMGFPAGPILDDAPAGFVSQDRPSARDVAMVLLTSGSTGAPKRVPLTHANLFASIRDIVQSLRLTPADQCLCLWEQFHIGGLVDLLLAPLASGGSVLAGPGFDAATLFLLLDAHRPTWFQAVPAALHDALDFAAQQGRARVHSPLRFIRSVAAALPAATREKVVALFGVPVVQTFGMTEAAPLITSTRLPPGADKEGSVGRALSTELAIVDDRGHPVPRGHPGEVLIRGPNVMAGYEQDDEANRLAFRDGWFRTGDIGCVDEDGELFLKGRVRDMINRGGEKIWPCEIEDALARHPAVAQAAAFPVPHRVLGEEVAVAVVRREGAALSAADVRSWLADRISSFKLPRHVAFVDALPRGPTGKINRRELATARPPSDPAPMTPPQTPLERKLSALWSDILGRPQVGVDDDFFDLGGSSLSAVRMLTALDGKLALRLAAERQFQLTNIRELARRLERDACAPCADAAADPGSIEATLSIALAGSGLPRMGRGGLLLGDPAHGASPPLFWCFNAPAEEWPALNGAMKGILPVRGMFSGGALLDFRPEVHETLAGIYADAIREAWPRGPLRLGGNCRGGAVMMRVARRFVEAGRIPDRLVLMESFDPLLFPYPGRAMLLFGKQSDLRAHLGFRWGRRGWRKPFERVPHVDWLPGEHGTYFRRDSIRVLARHIELFLGGAERSRSCVQKVYDWWLTGLHAHPRLFSAYVRACRRRAAGGA